jgi:hypothetical protein
VLRGDGRVYYDAVSQVGMSTFDSQP